MGLGSPLVMPVIHEIAIYKFNSVNNDDRKEELMQSEFALKLSIELN